MGKIIKKESFEREQTLVERLDQLSQEMDVERPFAASKIVSKHSHVVQEEAGRILGEAKQRASEFCDESRKLLADVEGAVAAKKAEGFEEGYQEGLAEATERLTAVSRLEAEFLKDVEPKLVRLAYDIAERVIGRELSENPQAILEMVRQPLREVTGSHLILRVNPQDYRILKEREKELLQTLDSVSSMTIKEDARISEGGCVVDSELGTIDAQLPTQLAAIRRALNLE